MKQRNMHGGLSKRARPWWAAAAASIQRCFEPSPWRSKEWPRFGASRSLLHPETLEVCACFCLFAAWRLVEDVLLRALEWDRGISEPLLQDERIARNELKEQ